jgi:hypothetical protein
MISFKDHLDEKLTLQYHNKLNQKLFDDDVIRDDVRIKMLEVAQSWQKFSKIPDIIVKDVIFTGGNANYNFSRYSDIDVHLVIDKYKLFHNKDFVDDYLAGKKTLWSLNHHIKIKGYPVELYAQDLKDILVASGVYSLRYNKWIAKPIHGNYNFKNDEALENKVNEFQKMILDMIKNKASYDDFEVIKKKIINMRRAALSSGNEFSFENLVYKELRNRKVFDKMNDYIKNIEDKELSLK